jgi:hypothetical protein
MLHDVLAASYQGAYGIAIELDDGVRGVVDFSRYAERGGVFERFKDIQFFRNFSVNDELGTITWGKDADIAPETLYAAATGSSLPAWMPSDEEGVNRGARPERQ